MIIRSFKIFESNSNIDTICKQFNIRNYTVENDLVNVDDNVVLSYKNLTKIPLKFGHVGENFYCNNNQLTSLEGCPQTIVGHFNCSDNQLTSLKYCPQTIGGDFYCPFNEIKDFGDKPFKFRTFDCDGNPIDWIYCLNPCKEFIEYLIEYQVIRNGNKIVKQRLIKALEDSGWDGKGEFKFKNYELI